MKRFVCSLSLLFIAAHCGDGQGAATQAEPMQEAGATTAVRAWSDKDEASVHDGGPTNALDASPAADVVARADSSQVADVVVQVDTASDSAPVDTGLGDTLVALDADAAVDACSLADDPDDQGTDTNCDGADGVVGRDVYVSPTAGNDTNIGSPSLPLKTLTIAIARAVSRHGSVFVSGGPISLDSVAIGGTWAVYGGYAPSFLGAPQRSTTLLQASTTAGLLIDQATDEDTYARLTHLSVRVASTAQPSSSSLLSVHALRTRATTLALDDVDVEAPNAFAGAFGSDGSAGANGDAPTCSGVARPRTAQGAMGTSPDGHSTPGSIANKVPALHAQSGLSGTDGHDASPAIRIEDELVVGDVAAAGNGDGMPGFGGAGGASDATVDFTCPEPAGENYCDGLASPNCGPGPYSVSGAVGGAGGCQGSGGSPGVSGGTSAAVVVLRGSVAITRSSIKAGAGGAGGDGGNGGAGGAGEVGGPPDVLSYWGYMCLAFGASDTLPLTCTPSTVSTGSSDPMNADCAAYGGQGGNGGAGGHGGGGAGGGSVGVLVAAGAAYSGDTDTTIRHGQAGNGGIGAGLGAAPSGQGTNVLLLTQ